MKYSKVNGAVRWSGGTTILGLGTTADDEHPLVLERPDLFGDEAPGAHLAAPRRFVPDVTPDAEPPIERATRAPGEKRAAVKKPGAANE